MCIFHEFVFIINSFCLVINHVYCIPEISSHLLRNDLMFTLYNIFIN